MARAGNNHKGGQLKDNVRPKITTYWTQEDIADYFNWLKKEYKKQPTLAKFVGEQLMGKAVQPIGNDDEKPFNISIINAKKQIEKIYG